MTCHGYYATHAPGTGCWLGQAALAVSETEGGVAALRRACELEEAGGEERETDAAELLETLE